MSRSSDRSNIYYWKSDRPAALHGIAHSKVDVGKRMSLFQDVLETLFPGRTGFLRPGCGQGNHLTFRLTLDGSEAFARIEDGPEGDNYFEVEQLVCEKVGSLHIPVPRILAFDCTRNRTPFAWQILDYLPFPDLNQWVKAGELDPVSVAYEIGRSVAYWQTLRFSRFGPFSANRAAQTKELIALHETYEEYFLLNLERHAEILVCRGFLGPSVAERILETIEEFRGLLKLEEGCLVHKDLALWNMLGTTSRIAAFIDWDDVISGDPMDDLSLLGCFYNGPMLSLALEGYTSVRQLPEAYRRRFWLHLLRNMMVKALIRVEAGYFRRSDEFFLIDSGLSGADFKLKTYARLIDALEGLNTNREIENL